MAEDWVYTETGMIAIAALAIAAVCFILVIVLSVSLAKAKKRYKRLSAGNDGANMEGLLLDIRDQLQAIRSEQQVQKDTMNTIQAKIKTMKSKVGIHRYNAFHAEGSDMSFTIAMLDEETNGIVVTGIHSRDQTYVYAKPIENGQSKYNLSPEEKETITRTLRSSTQ
ncbi:DUF4446 family protein [Paenibacillus chartarius]|uniref:DUF4446 family protein n=1 Tax=Paenibacillus chartarius TaxID=747481 RepID=A0ABV6DE66_9BACL